VSAGGDALIERLPRTTLVLGKGGVGKTTCASALALHAAKRIGETLVISTDPARALPQVLEQEVGTTPTAVRGAKRLQAQVLDADALRARFLERWGDIIRLILDRGTYLDASDIGPLVDTALPGSDEIFAALELARLVADDRSALWAVDSEPIAQSPKRVFERVIVDTAPTGHTLRLLNLPKTFRALVRLLEAMQAKHRFMVQTLTRAYRSDAADAFLSEMNALVGALEDALGDARRCVAVFVTNPESLVQDETRRYLEALHELNVHVGAVVWNATDHAGDALGDAEQYVVPRLDVSPVGKQGLEQWLAALKPLRAMGSGLRAQKRTVKAQSPKPKAQSPRRKAQSREQSANFDGLIRALTIVAGKGGVGKTTVASVLALQAAESRRTLVVSTDPAPSLADALDQRIPDADTAVQGEPRLFARQMDASAAFARLRDEYQSRVDALFRGLVTGGVDLAHDRVIVRDLLALAPPGVDEVYALSLLSDALHKDRYACVIVDPAPTGHLLRLLEMPQLALAWSHQLLRLMLKYKDVTGLGETAQEILEFARSLRAVDALLHDEQRCGLVLVTLDEPVVRAESQRLATEVRRRNVALSGVVLNRVTSAAALPVADAPLHFEAPLVEPPPIGAAALRRWGKSWRAQHATKEKARRTPQNAPTR
jgi:arsenite-transporting ATPase